MSERTILHLDLDTFFVSVERLVNSRLQGLPVIIGGLSDRGVVAGCSYEARQFGVHSAMPMKLARMLCGDAVFIRGDMGLYSRYSRMVTEIIAESAPVYEKASVDEHYLDITGMDRFFGSLKWSQELRQRIIRESGLPISWGLSVNKTVSKIATGEAKPNGEREVPLSLVRGFLDPLPIGRMPMIGEKTSTLLRSMGVATIGTLSAIPREMMVQVLGKNGEVLWKRANGIDHTPVQPYSEQKSASKETTFENDTIDIVSVEQILVSMVEKLAFQLRNQNKLTGCITVKIRYANFDTHTLQKRIPYTAFDHVMIPLVHELFRKLYQRRMLIRLVGIRFSDLVGGSQQLSLFEDTPELISLYQALDRIRHKHGSQAIRRAVGTRTHRG
jgi:DNA polymerase IV